MPACKLAFVEPKKGLFRTGAMLLCNALRANKVILCIARESLEILGLAAGKVELCFSCYRLNAYHNRFKRKGHYFEKCRHICICDQYGSRVCVCLHLKDGDFRDLRSCFAHDELLLYGNILYGNPYYRYIF